MIYSITKKKFTIQSIDPVGFEQFGAPFASVFVRNFTVASPKSPIFTVVPSVKKMLLVFKSLQK